MIYPTLPAGCVSPKVQGATYSPGRIPEAGLDLVEVSRALKEKVLITRPTEVTGRRLTVEGDTMSGALAGLRSGKMTLKRMR